MPTRCGTLAAGALLGAALIAAGPQSGRAPEAELLRARRDAPQADPRPAGGPDLHTPAPEDMFRTADRCLACHQGVATSEGLDVSIGFDWRASIMANSARDPYWQAAVRREVMDHPEASGDIQAECSRCHMPMANAVSQAEGRSASVFDNLPVGANTDREALLAADGVSCAVCHQISPDGLGTEASFVGGFRIALEAPPDGRPLFGPFEPDPGGVGIMRSATGFRPTEGTHTQSSELCATCHTLFTHAVGEGGRRGPGFPEQVPYLEWRASSFYAEGTTCQDCHMPEVTEDVPVTGVLGRDRPNVSRHVFRGGNFFMLRMLNRYRDELGVSALPQELELAATRTEEHLRGATAELDVASAAARDGRLEVEVDVVNRAGHKFPTAYPSRRAWLHFTVRDGDGRTVFESGAFSPDGSVVGSDHDEDGARYEPHYDEITRPDQVQVYEGVMLDGEGRPTTGLMSAERWAKDNRLLPRGYDQLEDPRVGVVGGASTDADFTAGSDRVRYSVEVNPRAGPFRVSVEMWFQPIAYRWAQNLADYDAFETARFLIYYREMAAASAIVVAAASSLVG